MRHEITAYITIINEYIKYLEVDIKAIRLTAKKTVCYNQTVKVYGR